MNINYDIVSAAILSVKTAGLSTALLLLLCIPLALLSRNWPKWGRSSLEIIASIPLAIPPSVLGLALLYGFSPNAPLGLLWESVFGQRFAFNYGGVLAAIMLTSLPFVLHPLLLAIKNLDQEMLLWYKHLGLTHTQMWLHILIPSLYGPILLASALAFVHAMGEFGVVLSVGGAIRDETLLLSVLVFEHTEALDFVNAKMAAGVLLLISLSCATILLLCRRFLVR